MNFAFVEAKLGVVQPLRRVQHLEHALRAETRQVGARLVADVVRARARRSSSHSVAPSVFHGITVCTTLMPVAFSNGARSFAITSFSSVPNGRLRELQRHARVRLRRLTDLDARAAAAVPARAPAAGSASAAPAAFLRKSRRLETDETATPSPASSSWLGSPNLSTVTSFSFRGMARSARQWECGGSKAPILSTYMQRLQVWRTTGAIAYNGCVALLLVPSQMGLHVRAIPDVSAVAFPDSSMDRAAVSRGRHGGAGGIGRACCARLAEAGATVVEADVDVDGGVEVDVRAEGSVRALADHALETCGRLDVWVNAAGIYPTSPLLALDTARRTRCATSTCAGCSSAHARRRAR